MRQVQVILTCDACSAWHDAEVAEGVATVPASGGQTLDLCPDHRETMAPFLALVAEWGQSPDGAASRPVGARRRGRTPSPAAEVPAQDAPATAPPAPKNRRGGKRARARRAAATAAPGSFACPLGCDHTTATPHGMGQHLRATHGRTASEVFGGTCPLCNHVGTAAGMGVHARLSHGSGSVYALFAQATAEGDPHGVIASRVKAVGQAAPV